MPIKWWSKEGREEVPDELKDLTPAQLMEAVNKSKDVDTLRTQLTEATTRLSEFDEVKGRLDALEANPRTENQPQPTRTANDGRPVSVLHDEDMAFAQRQAPLAAVVFQTGALAARQQFVNSLTGDDKLVFTKYGSEVDAIMDQEPANHRIFPGAWRNAYDMVSGRHMRDILKAKTERSDFFAEAATGTGGGGPAESENQDRLTPEEEAVANKMHMTPADYLKQKKDMKFYGGE